MSGKPRNTYITSPKYNSYLNQGFRPVKDYDNFILFEKVKYDKVLYRECMSKFDLYGAEWALKNRQADLMPRKWLRGAMHYD